MRSPDVLMTHTSNSCRLAWCAAVSPASTSCAWASARTDPRVPIFVFVFMARQRVHAAGTPTPPLCGRRERPNARAGGSDVAAWLRGASSPLSSGYLPWELCSLTFTKLAAGEPAMLTGWRSASAVYAPDRTRAQTRPSPPPMTSASDTRETLVLGIETSCDETAAAVVARSPDGHG